MLVTFDLPLSDKLPLEECLALVSKQGYQRLLLDGQVLNLDDVAPRITRHASRLASLTVVQDRLRLTNANRPRFIEACEQAYHFGKGKLALYPLAAENGAPQPSTLDPQRFSNRLHCATCDIEYREPLPCPVQLQPSGRRLSDLQRLWPGYQH